MRRQRERNPLTHGFPNSWATARMWALAPLPQGPGSLPAPLPRIVSRTFAEMSVCVCERRMLSVVRLFGAYDAPPPPGRYWPSSASPLFAAGCPVPRADLRLESWASGHWGSTRGLWEALFRAAAWVTPGHQLTYRLLRSWRSHALSEVTSHCLQRPRYLTQVTQLAEGQCILIILIPR